MYVLVCRVIHTHTHMGGCDSFVFSDTGCDITDWMTPLLFRRRRKRRRVQSNPLEVVIERAAYILALQLIKDGKTDGGYSLYRDHTPHLFESSSLLHRSLSLWR